jgi:Tyrosine phosphatase family
MTTMKRLRATTRWVVRLGIAVVIAPLCYVAWDQATYNFGAVQQGHIYRSGQMSSEALARTIRDHHIKTVLNLRGSNRALGWYREEVAATNREGATQIDVAMSSCVWMSRAQLGALIESLDTALQPVLIHCWWGSERTGLVSAFAELLRPGSTLADARAQFSLAYLYVRINDGKVMAEHLDLYESWLLSQRLTHEPATFRRWVKEGFKPGMPNREQWPYDPYPVVVITRPGTDPEVRSVAGNTPDRPVRK